MCVCVCVCVFCVCACVHKMSQKARMCAHMCAWLGAHACICLCGVCVCVCVCVFSSIQDGIYALTKAHMHSNPSLRSLPNIASQTVSMFI